MRSPLPPIFGSFQVPLWQLNSFDIEVQIPSGAILPNTLLQQW